MKPVIAKGGTNGTGAIADFSGGGSLLLGPGNDPINGFGSQQIDGGTGKDVANFALTLDQVTSLGTVHASGIDITVDGTTMSFINVEQFVFAGTRASLADLQALV